MIEPDDTLPKRNLGAGEEWGRVIESTVKDLVRKVEGQALRINNTNRTTQGALDLGAAQGQQIVEVQGTAQQVQSEQDLLKQLDPNNLFDYTPILLKDASRFFTATPNPAWVSGGTEPYYLYNVEAPNITTWFDDGFTITAPRNNYEIDLGNPVPYRNNGQVRGIVSFTYAWTGTGSWPTTTAAGDPQVGIRSWVYFGTNPEGWAGYDYPTAFGPTYPASGTYTSTNVTYNLTPALDTLQTWRPAIRIRLKTAGDTFTVRAIRIQAAPSTVTEGALPGWVSAGASTPGTNRFDTAPIAAQNINGYDTLNLGGYNWFSDGIQVQTPANNLGVDITMKDRVAVKPGDVLVASVGLDFSETAGSTPVTSDTGPYMGNAGFGLTFYNADGSVQGASTSIGWNNTSASKQSQFTVPLGAVSVKINLYAYIPNNASYIGYNDPTRRIWVRFRSPYVGVVVGTNGIADKAITKAKLADDVTFGVADDSLTTAKYQNLSVTDAKIASVSASKVGTGYPIGNTTGNLPATRLTGPILNSQIGGSQVDIAQLTSAVLAKLVNTGSFRNIYNDPDLSTGFQSIPNSTWTQMPFPTLTSDWTRENTLNDGSAATLSGNYLVAPKTGRYLVNIAVRFAGNSNGTARGVAAQVGNGPRNMENSLRSPFNGSLPNFPIPMTCSAEVKANAGDIIRATVTQNSGAALNCRLETFTVSYLGQ